MQQPGARTCAEIIDFEPAGAAKAGAPFA